MVNEMKWQTWTKDNLPESGKMTLLEHKYGHQAARIYFYNDIDRNHYIEWCELLERTSEAEKKNFEIKDPVVRWMYWPGENE